MAEQGKQGDQGARGASEEDACRTNASSSGFGVGQIWRVPMLDASVLEGEPLLAAAATQIIIWASGMLIQRAARAEPPTSAPRQSPVTLARRPK